MNAAGKSIRNPPIRNRSALETKVMLGFGAAAVLLILLGISITLTLQRYNETDRWVIHTHLEQETLQDLLATVYRAEAGQRGYFISGKEVYLEERNQAFARLDGLLDKLKEQTRNNPVLLPQAEELAELINQRRYILNDFLRLYQSRGFAATQKRFGVGPPVMARVRQVADAMRAELKRLLELRMAEEDHYGQRYRTMVAVLVISMFAFFAVMLLRVRRDLAQRQNVELEQKRLTDILDATPDYIATATLDGRYLYLNKGGRKLAGIGENEDVSGLTISGMHPQWASELLHRVGIPAALNSGSWIGESAFLTRSGQEFPASQVIIAHRNEDGTPAYLSTIARDISKQKQVEQEISNAARYDKTHGEVLRMFNATFDRDGILQGMLRILAMDYPMPVSAVYLYDEWKGRLHLAASLAAPPGIADDIAMGEGLVGEAAQQNRMIVLEPSSQMSDMAIATGLLTFPPACMAACPVIYQEKLLGVMVVAASTALGERDRQFLERLCSQLGVALHNVQQYGDLKLLAEQLRLRGEEINSKNLQLEEASRMKSEFLANMSHELRTPLNAIIGFSEVMRDGLTGPLADKQREYVSDIFESGQHLLLLINDVLDLSKIEAGKMVLEGQITDVASLLASSLSIIKEKAAAHHVKLRLDAPEALGECWLDARKVKQIVYNLLSNAVKFTPEGGEIALRARLVSHAEVSQRRAALPQAVTAPPQPAEQFLEISVSDTGIGIAADDIARLFQPFVQLDSSLSRRFEGTGLGLAMVRKLAELHGGAVAVSSQPNQGSTFTVWLPYHSEAAVPAGTELPADTARLPAGKTPLVLVVEDDDKAADLIRLQLEADGCRVVRAATAEIALNLLEQAPLPDLISLDILLPGMDGWEFLTQIKAKPAFAHIPVVILSIVADSNRSRGISLGASEILQKPVSADDLAEALANLGMKVLAEPGKPATVLVVDDDPKAVEIVASFLEFAHYTVLRAYGGAEGIQMAQSRRPDLIVLDLMMPEVSGFEVVETLKKQKQTAAIPILVLTAKLLNAEDRRVLNGHVMQVMEKSEFNHGNFISEVRRAFGRKWNRADADAVAKGA